MAKDLSKYILLEDIIKRMYKKGDTYKRKSDFLLDKSKYDVIAISKMILTMYFDYMFNSIIFGNEWKIGGTKSPFKYIYVQKNKVKSEEDIDKYLKIRGGLGKYENRAENRYKAREYFFNPKTIGYYYSIVLKNLLLEKKGYKFFTDTKQKRKLYNLLLKTDLHYEYEEENLNKKCNYKASGRNRSDSIAKDAIIN